MTSKQVYQQFARQYADAIDHMMATKATHLDLPKNFLDNWNKAQQQYRKDYPLWTRTSSTILNMGWHFWLSSAWQRQQLVGWCRNIGEGKMDDLNKNDDAVVSLMMVVGFLIACWVIWSC